MIQLTTAPDFVRVTSIQNSDYITHQTNNCAAYSNMPAEYDIELQLNSAKNSSNPIQEYINAARSVIIQGPNLDQQYLKKTIDQIKSLPPELYNRVATQISNDFDSAYAMGCGTKVQGLVGDLARTLCSCTSPCNYFKPLSDNIATYASVNQSNTSNTAPLWDNSELMYAPYAVADTTFNGISPTAQQLIIGAAIAAKRVIARGSSPVFSSAQISEDRSQLMQGRSIGFKPHGYYLTTDPFPYFETQNNASNILANTSSVLKGCYAQYELKRRFNPHDVSMNLSVATPATYSIAVENSTAVVDLFGKPIHPSTKPQFYSIYESLDHKVSDYEWDDYQNWTIYPTNGSSNQQPTPLPSKNNIPVNGTSIDYTGNPGDPFTTPEAIAGVGIDGSPLVAGYSISITPDLQTALLARDISPGSWINVITSDGITTPYRWDLNHSGAGNISIYNPNSVIFGSIATAVTIQPGEEPSPLLPRV